MEIAVRRATSEDKDEWFRMRKGIWPETPDHYLNYDLDEILASERDAVFISFVDGVPAGMIEASLREFGEGCSSSPVGYIEGWFVYPSFRGQGVSAALVEAAENWARENRCVEMASDTWLDNGASIHAHGKLGYQEVERLVHFVKHL